MELEQAVKEVRETIDALTDALRAVPHDVTVSLAPLDNGAPTIPDRIARALESIADSLAIAARHK